MKVNLKYPLKFDPIEIVLENEQDGSALLRALNNALTMSGIFLAPEKEAMYNLRDRLINLGVRTL